MQMSQYRMVFLLLFEVFLIAAMSLVVLALYKQWKKSYLDAKKPENLKILTSGFNGDLDEVERQNVIRQITACDGVDPSANHYMAISDGGVEIYARSVTISKLPKKVRYAETFKKLMNFPNCTSSVFVEPIDSEEMGRKFDNHINILGSEEIAAKDNTNRVRKLVRQKNDVEKEAEKVEAFDKKFFYAGFLFTLYADSVEELNKETARFRRLAIDKKMDISNCYAVQSEAYLANMPFNRKGGVIFGVIDSDAVKKHLMDQDSLSVILHYTTDYFTHKKGIPLGRNLFNGMPAMFDIYDPSHNGFTIVIAGKTTTGKSATIKIMIERYVPLGYRFVIIDSQTRKGTSEGEYASSAEVNGGINFEISNKSKNILNPFQVRESVEWIKQSADSGYEVRTLDLNGSITEIICTLRTLMQIGMNDEDDSDKKMDLVMDSDINSVLTKVTKELFAERGIVHGDADSLYEEGDVVVGAMLQSGFVPKQMPTISDCFKKILIEKWNNKDPKMDGVYKFILNNLQENVRELYYVEKSRKFFSREEYLQLPINPDNKNERIYRNEEDDIEPVRAVRGIRPYFDGQSTLFMTKNCPVVTIGISQLSEKEKRAAREISTRYINENFIKANSENLSSADKLVIIVDEAHENFEYAYGRKTFENAVRTAAKRNSSLIFATQTVKEFSYYKETENILKQAAVKMVFKQDGADRDHLVSSLNITKSQAQIITNTLGVVTDVDDPAAKNRHMGEMCLIDGEQVSFIKVDFLRRTEALSVERDASEVMKVITNVS